MRKTRRTRMIVVDASAAEIRRALRAHRQGSAHADPKRIKIALNLLTVLEKFFKQGGRFKRPYHRRGKKGVK